jgi:hypothetical protein
VKNAATIIPVSSNTVLVSSHHDISLIQSLTIF